MKMLFIFMLLPALSIGQTVHMKDHKIVYEGKERIPGVSTSELLKRLGEALPGIVHHYHVSKQSDQYIQADGELRMNGSYSHIHTVNYSIQLIPEENGYQYRIDSVFFKETVRGGKTIIRSSKEVLDDMGEAGQIVWDTEKILNETDMRFREVLDKIKMATLRLN